MSSYFISDLHLKPQRPDLTRALLCFLDKIAPDADALYLLGDIFEAWIGDDAPYPNLTKICQRLQELSEQGCELYFQHGNRDFLVGTQLCQQIGASLLPEYAQVNLPCGQEALLIHGDQLCTDDTDYMAFRDMVRSPEWQQAFLAKPVSERLEIARQLRDTSKAQGAMKAENITDVNNVAVAETLAKYKVRLMIHGHTHRPKIHRIGLANGKSATRIVLGDWDKSGWYLKVDHTGYDLISFPITC
ncbi:UDP-2,3-diacylglucosamine diphosphatase [Pontibacter sp. JAM-7]|uniref:UDP-2,3-diacylglucosamine diphosphatase n=1 Tax=Pontibacter sp. JAM-7 TaxID=3366581 RepID=UPI003AF4969A